MRKNWLTLVLFICSAAALCISLNLFYNLAIYADEYNTTPTVVCGGEFWLIMDWLRLFLLMMITLISAVKLFRK